MKILLKALILGCFLLIVTPSFSQAKGIIQSPIKLLSTNIQASAVIHYSFAAETNISIEILNSNQKSVKTINEVALADETKKYDFTSLQKGMYTIVFKTDDIILLEQQIEKL